MSRAALERHQVWIGLAAILAGLALGRTAPVLAAGLDALLWPALAALLYVTFVQVPLLHVRAAFADRRFLGAALGGNFLLIPLLVWALLPALPDDPAVRLGVLLVLLVPCTDWFITFTQLGGGSTARAIAVTPLNLLVQLLLLPLWVWLLLPSSTVDAVLHAGGLLPAALALIALPLAAAALTERWIQARVSRAGWRDRLAWAPVPLLAMVVFLIAAVQADAVGAAGPLLVATVPVFVGFLVAAALLARLLRRALRLPVDAGRTLAYSLGTRNSFVVLPFALALPPGWEAAAMVIVLQSVVELFGMLAYLRWLPRLDGASLDRPATRRRDRNAG